MNNISYNTNLIEKVLEENPLLILSESKVILKVNKKRIAIQLNRISNVRIIKNRDLTFSFLALVFISLFYLLVLSPMNLNASASFMCFAIISILFISSFAIKKYKYTLLINHSNLGYNEVTISKKDSIHAENFAAKFKNGIQTKVFENQFSIQELKECL